MCRAKTVFIICRMVPPRERNHEEREQGKSKVLWAAVEDTKAAHGAAHNVLITLISDLASDSPTQAPLLLEAALANRRFTREAYMHALHNFLGHPLATARRH